MAGNGQTNGDNISLFQGPFRAPAASADSSSDLLQPAHPFL